MGKQVKQIMIKGIFFDLFGTLFIYNQMDLAWNDWASAFYGSLCKCGLKMNMEEFKKHCNGFFSKPLISNINNSYSLFEQRVEKHCLNLGLNLTIQQVKKTANACLNSWQKYVKFDPIARKILMQLKKEYILALISNFDHPPHIYSLLKKNNILHLFDSIIISAEVGIKKPNPSIFEFALKKTGLNWNEIIFVGDSNDDLGAANSAGIPIVLIQRKGGEGQLITDYHADLKEVKGVKKENSQFIISHLDELKEIIASLTNKV